MQVGVANDLWEQAQLVATWLQQQTARNAGDWGQFAVLFATHALQFVLALACQANGIPHTPIDIARLYRTNPAQDIAAYLTVLFQPNSATPNGIARVLRRPNKFLNQRYNCNNPLLGGCATSAHLARKPKLGTHTAA